MDVAERVEAAHATQASDVRLEGVTKHFDDVAAVDDISLAVEPGQFFALLVPADAAVDLRAVLERARRRRDADRPALG